jgi:signal transduction histidine kinase
VILSVADSGCGIPAADLERIFLRFARADPNRTREAGGFGLGLAIVRAIAEAHHGSARASSTLGQGSVFEVLLPAVPAPPPSPEMPAPPRPLTAQSSSPDAGSPT